MKKSYLILILLFLLFSLISCSQKAEEVSYTEALTISKLPDDIPVPEGAVEIRSSKGENTLRVIYKLEISPDEVKEFYNKNMPGNWAITKDWFTAANTQQRYYQTEDFNQEAKTGRKVILEIAEKDKTVISIILTDYGK